MKRFFQSLPSKPWIALAILATGALGAALTGVFTTSPDRRHPGVTNIPGWALGLIAVFALVAVVGLLALSEWDRRRRFTRGDRQERVKRLTNSLNEALTAIQAIQAEIAEGQRILERLENETRAQKELAKLTKNEAAAVEDTLTRLLRRSGIIRDLVIMLLGALIGAGLGYLLNNFLRH